MGVRLIGDTPSVSSPKRCHEPRAYHVFWFPLVGRGWCSLDFFHRIRFFNNYRIIAKIRSREVAFRSFFWNRFIRLYPSYWVWLAITVAAYFAIPPEYLSYQRFVADGSFQASGFWADHAHSATNGTLSVAGFANLTGLLSDALLYLSVDSTGKLQANPNQNASVWAYGFMFVGQYWSIGVELFFYLLAPFIVCNLFRVAIVFSLSASGFLETIWLALGKWAHFPPFLTYLQIPKFLWMFMIGATLAFALLEFPKRAEGKFASSLALLGAMYCFLAWRHSFLFPMPQFPWWLFCVLTLIIPWLFIKTGYSKIDRFIGDLSYPMYINHFIIIQLLGTLFYPNGVLLASGSIALAAMTVVIIEYPARRLKFGGAGR